MIATIPKLLPEELLHGYRGRLRLLNDLRDEVAVMTWLNRLERGETVYRSREMSLAELVAKHNESSAYGVVMQHSLWPFTAAVGRPDGVADVERFGQQQSGRTAMLRTARPQAWLCLACVEEDLDFWGLSYWRRSHQLPGVLWCDKHETALQSCSQGSFIAGLPDQCINSATRQDSAWVRELRSNPTVSMFVEICAVILESGLVLDADRCARAISSRSVRQGLCSTRAEAGQALLKLALERLPMRWLQAAFPKVDWSRPERILLFDTVFRHVPSYAASTVAIVLAAALTFTSVDTSLDELSAGACRVGERRASTPA